MNVFVKIVNLLELTLLSTASNKILFCDLLGLFGFNKIHCFSRYPNKHIPIYICNQNQKENRQNVRRKTLKLSS